MFWLEIVFPSDVFAKKITGYKVIQRWFEVIGLKCAILKLLMRKNDVVSVIFSCFESVLLKFLIGTILFFCSQCFGSSM